MKGYKQYYPDPNRTDQVLCLFDTDLGDLGEDVYVYRQEDQGMIAVECELCVTFCKKFKFKQVAGCRAVFYPPHGCKFCGHDHAAIDEECEDSIAERKKSKPNQNKKRKA